MVVKITAKNLKIAKTGSLEKFKDFEDLPEKPHSYEDSYKKAIRMLELSVEDIIEVQEDTFNQLVLDEWHWKHVFSTTNAMYKAWK